MKDRRKRKGRKGIGFSNFTPPLDLNPTVNEESGGRRKAAQVKFSHVHTRL